MARPVVGDGGPPWTHTRGGHVVSTRHVLLLCLQLLLLHHAVNAQGQEEVSGTVDPKIVIDTEILIDTTAFTAEKWERTSFTRTMGIDINTREALTIPCFAGGARYFSLSFQQDGSWVLVDNFFGIRQIGVSVISPRIPLRQTVHVSTAFSPSSSDFELILPFLQQYTGLGFFLQASEISFFAVGEYNDYDPVQEVGNRFQSILCGVVSGNTIRIFYIIIVARIDTTATLITFGQSIVFNVDPGCIVGQVEVFEIPTFNTQFRRIAIDDFNCRSFTSTAPPLPVFSFCPFYLIQSSGRWFRFRPFVTRTCIIRNVRFFGFGRLFSFCCYTSIRLNFFQRLLILQANTGFIFREFREIALQRACQRAGRQRDFNAVCPPTNSVSFRPPRQSRAFGDAAMTTLDNFEWDFNAIGFFIYWTAGSVRIDVRMESATPGSSEPSGAVIGGIAIKDGSTTIVAQLTNDNLEILLFSGGTPVAITATDYDQDGIFNNDQIEVRQNPNLDGSGNVLWTWFIIGIQETDYTVWVASYQPNTAGSRPYMLVLLSLDREAYFGDTTMRGLLGNWDDDMTNDLVPQGLTLADAISTDLSEREILNNFAMTYSVSGIETIYPAESGGPRSDEDFGKETHFVRDCETLIREFADQDALAVCNGIKDCECEYVTNGDAAALEVLMLTESVSNTTEELRTVLPSVNGSDLLQIRVGETFTTMYIAQGEEGVVLGSEDATLRAENLPPGAAFDEETGVLTWTPDDSILPEDARLTTELSITVFDSVGREGIALSISIQLCGTVIDQGDCNYDQPLGDTSLSGRFVYVASVCDIGWTDDFCQTDFNGCDDDTCKNGTCMDALPSDQAMNNRTYTCGACDEGFDINALEQCSDIDECSGVNNPCDQMCDNNVGSFVCSCMTGYLTEGTNCTNINECELMIDNCDQLCNDTIGSFECGCVDGYDLIGGICEQSNETMMACEPFPCDEEKSICILDTSGSPQCQCKRGFQLSSRPNVCEDVNECINMNTHECRDGSTCVNMEGGYTCTCEDGSTTDADQRGCTPCMEGMYGNECSQTCNCAVENCNATIGCESCISGFLGTTCADINECAASAPNPCGNFSSCMNSVGSFLCPCIDRYELNPVSDECEASNQCESEPCEFGRCIPINTEYYCACFGGYTGRNCEVDIDECATSAGLCLNGGTCRDRVNAFECECIAEYTGRRCEVLIEPPTPSTTLMPTEPPVFDDYMGSFAVNCELPPGTDTTELEDGLSDVMTEAVTSELEVTEALAEFTDVSEIDRLFTFLLRLAGGANISNTDVLNALGRTFDPTFGNSVELTCPDNVTELEVNIGTLNVGGVIIEGEEEEDDFNALPVILGSVLGVLALVLTAILIGCCARRVYQARVIVRTHPAYTGYGGRPGGMRWLPRGVMDARNLANIRRRERPIDNPWAADIYELETDEMPWNAWRGTDNAYYGRSVLRPGQIGARAAAFGAAGHPAGAGRFFRSITSGNFARPLPALPPDASPSPRHGLPRINFPRPNLPRFNFARPNFNVPNINYNGMRTRMSGWLSRIPWWANRQPGAVVEPVYGATPVYGTTPVYGSPVSALTQSTPVYAASPTVVTSPMVLMNQGVQLQQQGQQQSTPMYAASPTVVTSPMVLMNQQQGQQFHWQTTGI